MISTPLPGGPVADPIFTAREKEFIAYRYDQCLAVKEVAVAMGISISTVKYFTHQVLTRLGLAFEHGSESPVSLKAMKKLIRMGLVSF